MYGIIKNISIDNSETIKITCFLNNVSIKVIILKAEGECCSNSYYVIVDNDLEKFKTKNLIDIILDENETPELIDMFDVTNITGEHISPHYNKLVFDDGTCWNFLLINDSNGYYDGWSTLLTNDFPINKENNETKVIIIVGLPASGKTKYAENYVKEHDDKIFVYNDIVSNYTNCGFLTSIADHTKKTIIINDPRFCIANVFNGIVLQVQKYICDSNIKIVIFENNRDQCRLNLKLREKDKKIREKFMKSLDNFHNYYNYTNEIYKRFDYVILPVYHQV
jgi:hypothetical protein